MAEAMVISPSTATRCNQAIRIDRTGHQRGIVAAIRTVVVALDPHGPDTASHGNDRFLVGACNDAGNHQALMAEGASDAD